VRAVVVGLFAAGACAGVGCRTIVSRDPVAFVDATYHAFDGEEYAFGGWVLGRSCEEYARFVDVGGSTGAFRVGDSDRPRTLQIALDQALSQKGGTVFLANVSIENELIDRPFHPLQLCTVVQGAAMVPRTAASKKKRKDPLTDPSPLAKPQPPPEPPADRVRSVGGDDDDEDEK
jgi:hypothetical protein